jgi:hypothetical protein
MITKEGCFLGQFIEQSTTVDLLGSVISAALKFIIAGFKHKRIPIFMVEVCFPGFDNYVIRAKYLN